MSELLSKPQKIKRWGNSLALRLPSQIAEIAGITKDSDVIVSGSPGSITIKISSTPLQRLLDQITPENRHEEIEFGTALGEELDL